MQSGGWKGEECVAGLYGFSGEKFFALYHADDESRQIIFPRRIEPRHFRGFSPNQRASGFPAGEAHTFDKLLDDRRIEFPHGQIVEKEKRRCALNENVVDAMIDEVPADRGMHAHGDGDFKFGADAIGARNKNRLFPLCDVESKKSAEAANTAEDPRGESAIGMVPDALFNFISDGDVHSGIGIFHRG